MNRDTRGDTSIHVFLSLFLQLNMLMRLQEAANYNGNAEPESDCASIDSNMTQDSFAGEQLNDVD